MPEKGRQRVPRIPILITHVVQHSGTCLINLVYYAEYKMAHQSSAPRRWVYNYQTIGFIS
jgi:hypothetical protein